MTSDAGGNLATSTLAGLGLASNGDIAAINNQLGTINNRIDNLTVEARSGVALALASASLHYDPRPGKASLAVAFGAYKGASGIAAGLGYAVSDRMRVNAAFSSAPNVSDYGASVGASFTLN